MRFEELVALVGDLPAFEVGLLLAGDVDPGYVRRQVSAWTSTGRLQQLRRGLYAIAPPLRKVTPHPFVIANLMVRASYVSMQSALASYGMIPEYAPATTCITSRRPGSWQTPLGFYSYQHVKIDFFDGYRRLDVGGKQQALVATAEKALLDLLYLTPHSESPAFLQELRLQNLDQLDLDALRQMAEKSGSARLLRAVPALARLAQTDAQEYRSL